MLERLEDRICDTSENVLDRIKETTQGFYFVSQNKADFAYIRLYGFLDAVQRGKLNIEAVFTEIGESDCIVDMKDLKFVDSSGLMFFFKIHKHLANLHRRMFLCNLNKTVRQMFRITKTEQLFNIKSSPEDAEKEIESCGL